MREFIRDADGDVWERIGGDSWQCRGEDIPMRDRAGLERKYGPVAPCDIDGNDLTSFTTGDFRALVAAAFEDYARRLAETWRHGSAEVNPFDRCAKETASAIRRGEIAA
jgi:hypothetical protein